ncbi:MAG: YfiR family protein [Cytophaga sp.]|uniref:YfiR family protein n=1 Tax=Cytophaga sp. TaxID=29535 RepID=UPI003F8154AA
MSFLRKKTYQYIYAVLLAASAFILSAQTPVNREYQIKAVFIFNFTQFVEWPANTFATPQSPLIIGILGQDPFGSYLDQTIASEKVNGHPMIIKRFQRIEDIKECHLLFIHAAETVKMPQIISNLKGKSVLTVSDASGFIKQGGMIRFFTVDNKIQFQINPDAAKAAGLTISSKLLRLAEIVVPK